MPAPHPHWSRDKYTVLTGWRHMDVPVIHEFLAGTDWSPGVPRSTVARSLRHSLCFGVFHRNRQVGFARVITDRATFGYVADVFILESHRGRGLARWLMECVVSHPDLRRCRRLLLATRDAHGLYAKTGFRPLRRPDDHLERRPVP